MSYYVPLQCFGRRFKKYIFFLWNFLKKFRFLGKFFCFWSTANPSWHFWQMSTKGILGNQSSDRHTWPHMPFETSVWCSTSDIQIPATSSSLSEGVYNTVSNWPIFSTVFSHKCQRKENPCGAARFTGQTWNKRWSARSRIV